MKCKWFYNFSKKTSVATRGISLMYSLVQATVCLLSFCQNLLAGLVYFQMGWVNLKGCFKTDSS